MREKVVFCWPKVVICMKPSRQKIEQCEGKVEQRIFSKVFFPILSISIIILLLLAVCAKNMDGVEEVA